MGIDWESFERSVVATITYCFIGIVMFAISFAIIRFISPFSLRKEIEEDQNVALAVLIGAVIIGLSIIIASAVGG